MSGMQTKVVLYCSSLGTPCGISTYTEMLSKAQDIPVVSSLDQLSQHDCTHVHVQHEFGMMTVSELQALDAYCKKNDIKWYVTMHTVIPLPSWRHYALFRLLGRRVCCGSYRAAVIHAVERSIAHINNWLNGSLRLWKRWILLRNYYPWLEVDHAQWGNPKRGYVWSKSNPDYGLSAFRHFRNSQNFIVKHADCIVVHLEAAKNILVQEGAESIQVVSHGIQQFPTAKTLFSQDDGKYHVGCFGHMNPSRSILEIIEACDGIPNIHLHILSCTEFCDASEYLQKVQDAIEGKDWITLETDFKPLEEIVRTLSQCDLNVWFYDLPGGVSASGSICQYLAAKRPVIAAHTVMISDLYDFFTLVAPKGVEELRTEIERKRIVHKKIMDMHDIVQSRAWERVKPEYKWDTLYPSFRSHYLFHTSPDAQREEMQLAVSTLGKYAKEPENHKNINFEDLTELHPDFLTNPLSAYNHTYDNGNPYATPPDKTVIFLHLQKAGGTTLSHIIRSNVRSMGMRKDFNNQPNISSAFLLEEFRALPEERKNEERRKWSAYDALTNHVSYGVHELLDGPYGYITMLRDPIDRMLSLYLSLQQQPSTTWIGTTSVGERVRDMTLLEFLRDPYCRQMIQLGHLSTQMIAGTQDRKLTSAHLQKAKENLETFDAVLITEKFEKSISLLSKLYGWKDEIIEGYVPAPRGDKRIGVVTQSAVMRSLLSPPELQELQSLLRYDIELYDYAKSLFALQCQEHCVGRVTSTSVRSKPIEAEAEKAKEKHLQRASYVANYHDRDIGKYIFGVGENKKRWMSKYIVGNNLLCISNAGSIFVPAKWIALCEEADVDPMHFSFQAHIVRCKKLPHEDTVKLIHSTTGVSAHTIRSWLNSMFDIGIASEVIQRDVYGLKRLHDQGFKPETVVDIGGHIGTFSRMVTSLWPEATVHMFEPGWQEFRLHKRSEALEANVGPFRNIRKWPQALIGFPEKQSLLKELQDDTYHHSYERGVRGDPDCAGCVPINVMYPYISVTDFLRQTGMQSIDLLKLDCEGAETNILREIESYGILPNIGSIRGEWHGQLALKALPELLGKTHRLTMCRSDEDALFGLFHADLVTKEVPVPLSH